ncbi:MAG: hypothetical protein Q9160_002806 [Pyrenula sp. 1 TL-2023]
MGDLGPTAPETSISEHGIAQPEIRSRSRNVSVLVTGFGPFKSYSKNSSYLITTRLEPVLLPILDPNDPRQPGEPKVINLYVWPDEVRVSYSGVFHLIPEILALMPPIDYVLHIGMAAGRKYYSVESLAHRDGYEIVDIDGYRPVDEERYWRNAGCPEVLEPDLDVEAILDRCKSQLEGDVDIRISKDAGNFLCDFIFYTSLAFRKNQQEPKKVLFLHVPGGTDEPTIEKGAMITEALIRAMVGNQDYVVLDHRTDA